jgi:ribose-phosphate pyrophosphokinase
MKSNTPLILLATPEMDDLAKRLHTNLSTKSECELGEVKKTTFANGEIKTKIVSNVRHKQVVLLHSLHYPDPNTALIVLLMTLDALTRASAESITLVLPHLCYSRQDRKDEPRAPISARMVANLIQVYSKVERIMTLDLHADQIQGFYEIPVDNLYGALVHRAHLKLQFHDDFQNLVIVSPDFGGVVRARRLAKFLGGNIPVYSIDKRRTGPNQVEVMNFVGGDIANKDIVLYDDLIDTGGSLVAAAKVARDRGAKSVRALATHGVFSPKDDVSAEERFATNALDVVITESIPRNESYHSSNHSWLTILPLHELLADALYRSVSMNGSISAMFET